MKSSVRKAKFKFGAYLLSLRESRQMTREELAAMSGLDKALIRGLEKGTAWYEVHLVIKFVEALGIEFSTVAKQVDIHFKALSIPTSSPTRRLERGPTVRAAFAY